MANFIAEQTFVPSAASGRLGSERTFAAFCTNVSLAYFLILVQL
ncbi:MAG: hypothetical protein ABJQ34_05660 [Paracoccaceae bacterium]